MTVVNGRMLETPFQAFARRLARQAGRQAGWLAGRLAGRQAGRLAGSSGAPAPSGTTLEGHSRRIPADAVDR